MKEQWYICPPNGEITPEALEELKAFAKHIREQHTKTGKREDCPFCKRSS